MQTLETFTIHQFRGLKSIQLDGLTDVNLFVGDNNSGKTTIIEALSLFANPLDLLQWIEIAQRRFSRIGIGIRPNIEALTWLFPQKLLDPLISRYSGEVLLSGTGQSPIESVDAKLALIQGIGTQQRINRKLNRDEDLQNITDTKTGVELTIRVEFSTDPSKTRRLINEKSQTELFEIWEDERVIRRQIDANRGLKVSVVSPSFSSIESITSRYSNVVREREKADVLKVIQWFDPNITDMEILSLPFYRPTLHIEHKNLGLTPLYTFGDGLRRAMNIALSLPYAKDGILLIDEIETAIHISLLGKLFAWLVEACQERNIQLFATTHSLEAIDAILQSGIDIDKVTEFRLYAENIPPQRRTGEILRRLRFDRGLDARL